MTSICGILLFAAYLCLGAAHELPSDFERCQVEDEKCIVRRVNDVLRSYPQGFQELHLEKIDPLNVNSLRFAGNPNNPVSLDLTLSDLYIGGLSNLTVTRFEGFTRDPKDMRELNGEGVIPLLTVQGKFKSSGKLLVVPINGEGDLNVSVKNLQIRTQLKPVTQVRGGKTYLRFENPTIQVKTDRLQAEPRLHGHRGQNALADSTIKVINDNWEVLWDEVSPQLSGDILLVIVKILESFTNHFPYEDLFL